LNGHRTVLTCKRGAGTLVAFVMFLLIILIFVSGTFIWQVKSQSDVNALDTARIDEMYVIEPTFSFNDVTKTYSAIIRVENTGSVPLKLVQAWIIDEKYNDHQHIDISYTLDVDEATYIQEIHDLLLKLTHPFDLTTTSYVFRVVTERGNTAMSQLMPKAAFQSNWPAVIIPGASYVEVQGAFAKIHLEIWNRLTENLRITLCVMSRLGHGAETSELIEIDWILPPGVISINEFRGEAKKVYHVGSTCFIEIADFEGSIVSSFYFTVQ
jgi:hypothetical protein